MNTWHAVLILGRARWQIGWNSFWRGKLWHKLVIILALIGAGFLAVGLFFFGMTLIRMLRSPMLAEALREAAAQTQTASVPTDPAVLLAAVPDFALFTAFLLLIFSSFGSVLNSLYLSGDMDMLLTKPIPIRAVFIVKFFSGILTQYGLLLVFLAPALLGYGVGMNYGVLYILVLTLILLTLPLLPTGLGALLVMLIVRVIPANRARELIGILGALVAVSFYILSQFAPELAPHLTDAETLTTLLQLQVPFLPSAWAGRALIAAGEGQLLILLLYGGLFLLLSLLVFAGCLVLAERLYYAGWSNMATQQRRVRKRKPDTAQADMEKPPSSTPRIPGIIQFWAHLEPQSAAVFLKDWRLFPRDIRNVQQLLFPLALIGIWIFRLLTMPPVPRASSMTETLMNLSSVGITFFLCYMLSSILAGTAISREGRAFWLIKLAPVSPLSFLLGKLILAYLPYPLIGTPLLIVLTILSTTSLATFLSGWGVLLILGLGSSSLALGLGAIFPRIDWENPQQQQTFLSGCLNMLLSPVYIALVLVVIFGLPILATQLLESPGLILIFHGFGWLTALLVTALLTIASLYAGAERVDQLEL
jgi:ABC-2 type transport system permease protein